MVLYDVDAEKIRKICHGNWLHINNSGYIPMKARQLLSIDSDAFVMCFIGRISPDKGLHLLFNYLETVDFDFPIYLIVAGVPSSKKYIMDLIKKSYCLDPHVTIKWYPYRISDGFLNLLVNACDVGVLPYIKTSTPSSILLFMSFGKPVIAPSLPEVKEFIGCYDWLLYDDLAELHSVITRAINSKMELTKIGEGLLERAKMFDWKQMTQKTYEDYLALQR
jgi:glycosyltransferase involved in cell wall biosynthesis